MVFFFFLPMVAAEKHKESYEMYAQYNRSGTFALLCYFLEHLISLMLTLCFILQRRKGRAVVWCMHTFRSSEMTQHKHVPADVSW
jgi:hypothetical protein